MENTTIKINLETYESLGSLSFLSENIALSTEGFGTFLEKVGTLFREKLSVVTNALGVSNSQSSKMGNTSSAYIEDLEKNKKNLIWVVNNIDYIVAKQARVMAPVGLKVDLIKAASELEDVIHDLQAKVHASLDDLDVTISSVLNYADYRTQSKPLKPNKDAIVYSEKFYSVLNRIVDTKKMEDTKLIKDLIPNISSLTKVYDIVIKCKNSVSEACLTELNELIDNVYVKTQTLEKELEGDYTISKTVLNKLATDLENNAKLITVTMSVIYLFNQIVLCLNNLINKLINLK